MRIFLRITTYILAGGWAWLWISDQALAVWQSRQGDELHCHYITALDLVELTYFYQEGSPLGRTNCPLIIDAPGEGAYQ